MKPSFLFFILGAAYISTGVFFSRLEFSISEEKTHHEINREFYDYSGALNVHSKKSNGSGSVQEIITSASLASLDFIIFNESNIIDQRQPAPIKYGDLNVLYGSELNFRNSRLLYFSSERNSVFSSHSEIQLYISNFLETGGEGVMAISHPDKPGYEWDQDMIPEYLTGIEVLNLREVWRKAWGLRKISFLSSLIFYPFNPNLFFLDIYSDDAVSLKLWDEWNKRKSVVGYVGSDATSKLRVNKKFNLNFPSYKSIFEMAKNHIVLSEELVGIGDSKIIVEALKRGNSYFSIDILGDPEGFIFFGSSVEGGKTMMGESIRLDQLKNIKVVLPRLKDEVRVELYHNGDLLKIFKGSFEFKPKQIGNYRVMVRTNPLFPLIRSQRWIPWIFSNPIFIKGS